MKIVSWLLALALVSSAAVLQAQTGGAASKPFSEAGTTTELRGLIEAARLCAVRERKCSNDSRVRWAGIVRAPGGGWSVSLGFTSSDQLHTFALGARGEHCNAKPIVAPSTLTKSAVSTDDLLSAARAFAEPRGGKGTNGNRLRYDDASFSWSLADGAELWIISLPEAPPLRSDPSGLDLICNPVTKTCVAAPMD